MKLLTKKLENMFKRTGDQKTKEEQAMVIAKFFFPMGRYTFYATEYYPESRVFFGYAVNHAQEWGYESLDELESRVVWGLRMQRDCWWSPRTVKEAVERDARIEYLPGAFLEP